jgi:hypothetical protein
VIARLRGAKRAGPLVVLVVAGTRIKTFGARIGCLVLGHWRPPGSRSCQMCQQPREGR